MLLKIAETDRSYTRIFISEIYKNCNQIYWNNVISYVIYQKVL